MNLARFGLLKDDKGKIVPDGTPELVEVTESEALESSNDTYKIESFEEMLELASSLGAKFEPKLDRTLTAFTRSKAQDDELSLDPIPPKKQRKYVKHEKKTSKKFVKKMKKKHGLLDFDEPVEDMGPDEIKKHFAKPGSDGKVIDKNHFARNVVWSYYQRILAGKPPEFVVEGCNMRTIFYLLKPVFTQNKVFDDIDSFYGNFSKAVKTLVLAGLISYKDFNIMDDRKVYRYLPDAAFNTNVLLLAEKKSMVGRFTAMAGRYGVMSQITTGRSTFVMVDTMLTEMFELGYDLRKNLTILSFCDFDPVGTSIPIHFVKHLKSLGFHNINEFTQYGDDVSRRKTGERTTKSGKKVPVYTKIYQRRPCLDIVNIHEFETDIRNAMRHEMKSSIRDNPSTADWAFITGGVTGTGRNKKYAISSEQLLPYVNEHLEEKLLPLLGRSSDEVGRESSYMAMHKAIREYIGARAEIEAMAKRTRK